MYGGYIMYSTKITIKGIDAANAMDNVIVFHAGTKLVDGHYVNSGGRVLGVTAVDDNLDKAIARAYSAVDKISWKDEFHRSDIGIKKYEN